MRPTPPFRPTVPTAPSRLAVAESRLARRPAAWALSFTAAFALAGCMDAAVTAATTGAAASKAAQDVRPALDAANAAASTLATKRPDPDQ